MVDTVFDVIKKIHNDGVTILLVEQNALRALEIADRAYVVETGRILLSGTGAALRRNPEVRSIPRRVTLATRRTIGRT